MTSIGSIAIVSTASPATACAVAPAGLSAPSAIRSAAAPAASFDAASLAAWRAVPSAARRFAAIALRRLGARVCIALLAAAVAGGAGAQSDGFDAEAAALIYHKLGAEPLDLRAVAERSPAVRRASGFDRPDAIQAETARLQQALADADPAREFTLRINDHISEYDHERGEFSITLFTPGYFVPVDAFNQQYRIVFANAESARPIAMPKEAAREFDAQIARAGRGVVNEIRLRVIGKGDPAGAVTGPRVLRAELLGVRLLDPRGRVLHVPALAPVAAAAPGGTAAGASAGAGAPGFDLAGADVAGFRVGVKARDLEVTLKRLFGDVARRPAGKNTDARFAGTLAVNELGCVQVPGRKEARPGAVCVTALYDHDEVVRSIRVERVFPPLQGEVFRKTLVGRYGPVAAARSIGSSYALGWGPEVEPALLFDRSGPPQALTAHYLDNSGFMARANNALPQIRVVLHLVDAGWAAQARR